MLSLVAPPYQVLLFQIMYLSLARMPSTVALNYQTSTLQNIYTIMLFITAFLERLGRKPRNPNCKKLGQRDETRSSDSIGSGSDTVNFAVESLEKNFSHKFVINVAVVRAIRLFVYACGIYSSNTNGSC